MANAKLDLLCRSFHHAKKGHALDEYEDALACAAERGRFAVADGASESSYASTWAKLLTAAAVRHAGAWERWLPQARSMWQESFAPEQLPWFAEAKAEQGAYATLLSLILRLDEDAPSGTWKAQAVGDSCLFVVPGSIAPGLSTEVIGPIRHDAFPGLLAVASAEGASRKRCSTRGRWAPGDQFFLMTDALAHWFLSEREQGRKPWSVLSEFKDEDEFSTWLGETRDANEIRNDDVTLIFIEALGARWHY